MDPNMLHRYIYESPFFDHMSNNGLALAQAGATERSMAMSWNRQMFEDDLKRKRGVEYMIVGEPQPVPPLKTENRDEPGGWAGTGKNGIYVVRKQDRQFNRGHDGRLEEDLTILGTYYLVGENMYQAPSVGDVIGNRLVSATNSLSKFLETAAQLPSFDPTSGYAYLPNATKASASGSTTASIAGTPSQSREGSLAPGADLSSIRSTSLNADNVSQSQSQHASIASSADREAARLLESSLRLSLEFASEYMDENPLLGTPGNFSFTHSAAAIKKRRADEAAALEAAAAAAKAKANPEQNGQEVKAPSPPAVMTEKAGGAKERLTKEDRRGSKMGDKVRRKKSKANNALTPSGASATAATSTA
jgi:mediator of RNA polymerase II transcription subunit 6